MPTHPYAFLALFLLIAVAFPLIMLGVARLWARTIQPPKPGFIKNSTYESGVAPTGDAWIQFRARYYLYAILFLIFDVEVLFLLPFGVAFTGLSAGALLVMLIFIFLLAEGLAELRREHAADLRGLDVDVHEATWRDQMSCPERRHLSQARAEHEHALHGVSLEVFADRGMATQAGDPEKERVIFGDDAFGAW